MASVIYNGFKKKIMDGSIDLDTDTIKVALTTSSYAANIDSHVFFSDITNEVTGTGYSAGGAALANKVVTQDNTNDLAYFDADDASWPTSTISAARYAIIYKSTGTAATSPLIACVDLGSDQSSSTSTLLIQWDTTGILKLT
jgi:hypothetical protein